MTGPPVTLAIGLPAWIIQDGNYGNFSRGTQRAFALEFYPPNGVATCELEGAATPTLMHVGGAHYEASGSVVFVAADWWVVDFGVLAFRDQPPPASVRAGTWIRGKIYLGVDPFFYFERLAHQSDAPALILDWEIEKIEIQTAPFIEVAPGRMRRDPARLAWKDIPETDAWHDGPGAEYVLHGRLLDSLPRHARSAEKSL